MESLETVPADTLIDQSLPSDSEPQPYAAELAFIRTLKPPPLASVVERAIRLGPKTQKFTLVLDLDETLLSRLEPSEPSEPRTDHEYILRIRPYARELLERLSDKYELIVFTAACAEYAQLAAQELDPEGRYIRAVLSREHCLELSEGVFVKDLRVIADRRLNEVLIADNNIISFAFQLANGIPVTSYNGADEDSELAFLTLYLEKLYGEADIVSANKAYINLSA
jgi:CTD small phosphatase-like protein 2